jgi:hypothetical protein
MIKTNSVRIEGDSLIIEASAPIMGVLSILDYADNITNSDKTSKYYRISIDGGIEFTEWKTLTQESLQNETISPQNFFLIQYKYTKTQDSDTEVLFNDICLFVERLEGACSFEFERSIFAQFFRCNKPELIGWAVNVYGKAVSKTGGVVSNYIERSADFRVFFETVAFFFAHIVEYSRSFLKIRETLPVLKKYVKELGFLLPESDNEKENKDKNVEYMENSYSIYSKRGTISHINEYKDIISHNPATNLFISSVPLSGWWLNNTSPVYRNTRKQVNIDEFSFNEFIAVNSKNSYVLNFNTENADVITIKVSALNQYGVSVNTLNCINFVPDDILFSRHLPAGNHTAIIYASDEDFFSERVRFKLKMVSETAFLKIENLSHVSINIKDIKLRPAYTEYAPSSYLQPLKQVEVWSNNNTTTSDEVIYLKKYNELINYSNELKLNIK